ncbi:hypothetical protein MGG_17630 [Pyricularia oryzae 70-15]|uniref:Uncharacterized protein n=3 Tax=Pyricularia oryzae TaxID=318829 RepID=G4NGD6_PYRO7|nr:uncharacterized protein MGG_17630 [Pyricularia oryzae 70-15]EHA47093.1 hypothetical protein MGG_17630 [Pyricularia oryzae 70-15]ELQ44664.1 hypothetical protein OOU_Y34scaffold00069g3 [Pyricularia oryzae Y34]
MPSPPRLVTLLAYLRFPGLPGLVQNGPFSPTSTTLAKASWGSNSPGNLRMTALGG